MTAALKLARPQPSPIDDLRDRLDEKKRQIADAAIMHAEAGDLLDSFSARWPAGLALRCPTEREEERAAWWAPCRLLDQTKDALWDLHERLLAEARDLEYELAHTEAEARKPRSADDDGGPAA